MCLVILVSKIARDGSMDGIMGCVDNIRRFFGVGLGYTYPFYGGHRIMNIFLLGHL